MYGLGKIIIMTVNSVKFQTTLLQNGNNSKQNHKLQIDSEVIITTDSARCQNWWKARFWGVYFKPFPKSLKPVNCTESH